MPLSFSLGDTDLRLVETLRLKNQTLINALVEKMTGLMTRLQTKAQAKTKGEVAQSIKNPSAHAEGGNIVGTLDWAGVVKTYKSGKPYDIAKIIEEGADPHAINPLTIGGTRAHTKGAVKRFGSNVVHFNSQRLGKEVFAAYVFHPGIPAKHFMSSSIEEMRSIVREELQATVLGVMSELKR